VGGTTWWWRDMYAPLYYYLRMSTPRARRPVYMRSGISMPIMDRVCRFGHLSKGEKSVTRVNDSPRAPRFVHAGRMDMSATFVRYRFRYVMLCSATIAEISRRLDSESPTFNAGAFRKRNNRVANTVTSGVTHHSNPSARRMCPIASARMKTLTGWLRIRHCPNTRSTS